MKLFDFTIIKLTFCLIVGIISCYVLTIPFILSIYGTLCFLILLSIIYFISKTQAQKTIWFGIFSYVTMVSIGIFLVNVHDQRQFKDHYSNVISVEGDASRPMTFRIREVLKPTAYHDKYVINILKVGEHSVSGKLLLNKAKDSLSKPLRVDDILMTTTSLSKVNIPLNPYQFNYKGYLKKQYIDHQLFVENETLFKIPSKTHTLYGYAARIRDRIDEKLKKYHFENDELAIIDALLLGQRKDISQETYNNYVNAGAIHILAVSGLHVGIILLLLNKVFKPLERLKHGRTLKIMLLLFMLWSFAIIAGLSPSVTRAVAMFTVVAIGMNLKRPSNIYNTLAVSMFFILLLKPRFLFEVGFQMSYLAVISIVSIQPLIKKLWYPPNKIVRYFWDIFTVTLAAQIGVVPISLFYFHQFPGLFFISNLLVIPMLTLNLCFGIFVIVLALLNFLPQIIADTFGFCVSMMNDFVSWVSHQERFVFRDISFGIVFVIISYIGIIVLVSYFKKPNYKRLIAVLIVTLMIQGAFIYENFQNNTDEFIVFHKNRFSLIGMKQNQTLTVATNLDSLSHSTDNVIRNYKVGHSIETIKPSELQAIYPLKSEKLLVVDTLGIYNVKSFQPDYVLFRNSPRINLNRLIDSLNPKLIIVDGSNYKTYAERWKATCEQKKIPFHLTSEKGAFVYRY